MSATMNKIDGRSGRASGWRRPAGWCSCSRSRFAAPSMLASASRAVSMARRFSRCDRVGVSDERIYEPLASVELVLGAGTGWAHTVLFPCRRCGLAVERILLPRRAALAVPRRARMRARNARPRVWSLPGIDGDSGGRARACRALPVVALTPGRRSGTRLERRHDLRERCFLAMVSLADRTVARRGDASACT